MEWTLVQVVRVEMLVVIGEARGESGGSRLSTTVLMYDSVTRLVTVVTPDFGHHTSFWKGIDMVGTRAFHKQAGVCIEHQRRCNALLWWNARSWRMND